MSWWDLAFTVQREMQRAALQSFSIYSPSSDTHITTRLPQRPGGTQVVRLGEERLNVATRTVPGETTRLRRRVIAGPVEQQVTLREEKVIVERRPPTGTTGDMLTETVIEMSDSRQVPTVWKSLHVAEEVVLRKQVIERSEKVRETVRRDVLEVEHLRQPAAAPMDIASSARNVEARAEIAPPVPREPPQDKRAQQNPREHEEPQDKKQGQGSPPPAPQLAVHKS